MSKRDGGPEYDSSSFKNDQNDPPRRATAAQMANRKIATARKQQARRPYDTSSIVRNTPLPSAQGFGNTNTSSNGTQPSTFSFGSQSQSFGGTQNAASSATQGSTSSASFPPFSSIASGNTAFNFTNGSNVPNNPFATGMNNGWGSAPSTQSGGYQGSLFNVPPSFSPTAATPSNDALGKKKAEKHAMEDSAPMWAGGINPFSNDAPGTDQQPAANGLGGQNASFTPREPAFNPFASAQSKSPVANMFGSAQPQQPTSSQPTSNPFSNAPSFIPTSNVLPASPSQRSNSNIFSQAPSQKPSFDLFGTLQSQQPVSGQSTAGIFGTTQQQPNTSHQTMSNIFGTSQPQQTGANQPASNLTSYNLYGASQPQQPSSNWFEALVSKSQQSASSQAPTSQSTPGIFSHLQPQQNQPLSNLFGNNNHNNVQSTTSPTQNEGDSMSTTPDTSPSAAQQAKQAGQGAFAFLNTPASSSQGGGGSFLGRVSQPLAQDTASMSSQHDNQDSQLKGASLFDRTTRPDEGVDQSSKDNAPSVISNSEAPRNIFTGFGQPSATTSALNGDQPKTSESKTPTSMFTGLGQPLTSTSGSKGDQRKTSEPEAPKSIFSGFGPPPIEINHSSNGDQPSTSSSGMELPKSTFPKSMFPGFGLKRASDSDQSSLKEDSTVAKSSSGPSQSQSDKPYISKMYAGLDQSYIPPPPPCGPPSSRLLSAPTFKAPTETVQGTGGSSTEASSSQSSLATAKVQPQSNRRAGATPAPPSDLNDDEKQQLITSYRLKAFDAGFKKFFRLDTIEDVQAALNYYQTRRDAIIDAANRPSVDVAGSKRKNLSNEDSQATKKARFGSTGTLTPSNVQQDGGEPSTSRPSSYQDLSSQSKAPKQPSPAKRKADVQLTKDDPGEIGNSAKKIRNEAPVAYPSLSPPGASDTSSIFKSIVHDAEDRPNRAPSTSPQIGPTSATPANTPAAPMFSPSKPSAPPFSATPAKGLAANVQSPFKPSVVPLPPAPAEGQAANPSLLLQPSADTDKANRSGATESPKEATGENVPASTAKPTVKPPTFGSGAPVNFMSQFQQMSKKEEQSEKNKRKADDLESDEDETEWDRQYEEEQRAKKQKINELAKGKKFVLGKGIVSSEDQPERSLFLDPDEPSSNGDSRASSVSVLDQPQKPVTNGMTNLFGHLSDVGSGPEGSKTGDADDEDTASEGSQSEEETPGTSGGPDEIEEITRPSTHNTSFSAVNTKPITGAANQGRNEPSTSRSLFDRMEKDKDGNLVKDTPVVEKNASSIFDMPASGNNSSGLFKASSSSLPPSTTPKSKPGSEGLSSIDSSPGNHSWKAGSPIKFGSNQPKPEVEITSPSPGKPALGGLFGSSQTSTSAESSNKPTNPFQSTAPIAPAVGFGISMDKPPSSLAPPGAASIITSRATSPAASSTAGSLSESGADNEEEHQEQIDLTSGGPGEEDEERLFEVRGRALEYDVEKRVWVSKGLGPVRVLKHPESGKARILVRQDPSGKIALNAALLSSFDYKHEKPKSIKFVAASETGRLLSYIIRVAKDEDAATLAKILEENKTA